MANSVTVELFNPPGSPSGFTSIGSPTNLLNARFTEGSNEPGDGSFSIPLDDPLASSVIPMTIALISDSGNDPFPVEIRSIDIERSQDSEHAGKILTASGPGAAVLFGSGPIGGAVVLPSCGNTQAFQADVRHLGWMDCCCFDAGAAGFSAPPTMSHRQSNPELPFTPDQPEDWVDPRAHRIYTSSPVTVEASVNEVQSIGLGNSIDSGVFSITFDGETTGNIGSPWSAANVESALEALPNIDGVTVSGTGLDSNPYVVTFNAGNVAGRNLPQMSVDHASLFHPPQTATVTTITNGNKGKYRTAPECGYFRKEFTTSGEQDLVAFISLSKVGEVYLDGVEIYSQRSGSSGGMQSVTLTLPPGDHCIAARACKKSTGGLAWFMMTLAEATENNDGGYDLGTVVVRTNDSWEELRTGASADPPGMTVGEIIHCFYGEAKDLAVPDLPGVTLDFTAAADSDSVAWTTELTYDFALGTGLLDAIQELVDLAGGFYRMNADLSLSFWQSRGVDRTGSVQYLEASRAGGVLLSSYTESAPNATTLFVDTQDGSLLNDAGPDLAQLGSRRLGVTLGNAPHTEGIGDFVDQTYESERRKWAASLTTWGPSGLVPYVNSNLEDDISIPNPRDGTLGAYRIKQFQLQTDEHNDAIWTINLLDVPS